MKHKIKYVSLIGAGRVAYHLGPALEEAGVIVERVYSRRLPHAQALAKRLYNAKPTDSLDFSDSRSQLFLLCVSDDALEEVASQIRLPHGRAILAHTSGTMPLSVLSSAALLTGIFYPLQTFSKEKFVDFQRISICLEASHPEVLEQLAEVASLLTEQVYALSDKERRQLHLAAVIACNFTNHLMAMAKDVMQDADLSFQMLRPLVQETIEKAFLIDHPEKGQTGPAVRGDERTLARHLQLLEPHPDMASIYRVLTESIQKRHGRNT